MLHVLASHLGRGTVSTIEVNRDFSQPILGKISGYGLEIAYELFISHNFLIDYDVTLRPLRNA
jgi:hypothetical protein